MADATVTSEADLKPIESSGVYARRVPVDLLAMQTRQQLHVADEGLVTNKDAAKKQFLQKQRALQKLKELGEPKPCAHIGIASRTRLLSSG